MPRPSIAQLKWFALFFGAFFVVSSTLQYFFVSYESRQTTRAELVRDAASISRSAEYKGSIDPKHYFKAFLDAEDYIVVLSDGSILDIDLGLRRPLRSVLPTVRCPLLTEAAYSGPITIDYKTDTIRRETWLIKAKKLADGTAIAGFSALDEIASAGDKLTANLDLVGNTVDEAARVNPSKLDNGLNFAVINNAGELVDAFGRLPLKTDALLVGQMSSGEHEIKSDDGKTFLAVYLPLHDADARPVGTIIQLRDITLQNLALRQEVIFNSAVAAVSFVAFLLLAAFYSARNEGEKRRIRQAFQSYFSPQIVEAILREPDQLKGQRREVTILFSDIRSFTTLTASLPPQKLTRLLQEYFDAMTDEVIAEDGIVDKYIGDAIMAFWGAPIEQHDQADRAVRAATNMIKRLKQLQQKWEAEGEPVLDIGIGINLGIATVGNLGATSRYDYTLVGDAVNVASRMEQLNKEHQSHIIISDSTKAQLTIPVQTKDLGNVVVRGALVPIRIYEVEVN